MEGLLGRRPRPPPGSEPLFPYRAGNFPDALRVGKPKAGKRTAGRRGLARNVDALMAAVDALAETADERGKRFWGRLHDYAEAIAPELQ